ncbi:MAG: SIS domain-containing protein [Methylobacterium mesophilicum]|nr:SIS domain-containing protein [Methylobacterium mesophilicum]
MIDSETFMRREVAEIPQAVARLFEQSDNALKRAGEALRQADPRLIVTIARGSSDQVATLFKYAVEIETGIPVASVGPSVASVYGAKLKIDGGAAVAVSQSGQSPDILAAMKAAGEGGALTVAVTNDPNAPLARGVAHPIDIAAGPEKSVAATKTFVSSAAAVLGLLAHWRQDEALLRALHDLPRALEKALACDWQAFGDAVGDQSSLFVLGRGPSFAVAGETALKFKETCGVHAESYSAAEVMHGPMAIVTEGFPVLALSTPDRAEPFVVDAADALADKGAAVFAASSKVKKARSLPVAPTGHPLTDTLSLVTSFYSFAEGFARARGLDPDRPPHLRKVTETR